MEIQVGSLGDDSSQTSITNGRPPNDEGAIASGAVFVFVRNGDTRSQQAYLKGQTESRTIISGSSVAISGNTIVVGAETEDLSQTTITHGGTASSNNSATRAGAVYVLSARGNGSSKLI